MEGGIQYDKSVKNQIKNEPKSTEVLDAATSSGILKAKQKLGVTFNSDKLKVS